MQKETINQILEKRKLIDLADRTFMKQLIDKLSQYSKNDFINPKELEALYRKDKDLIYAILDTLVKENLLEISINIECCRCGKIITIDKYLKKAEEYICEECGADNDITNCIRGYIVLKK